MYIYLLLLLILSLLSLTRTYIEFTLHRINEDDHIQIIIMIFFKLIKFKFKIPYIDLIINKAMGPSAKVKKEIETMDNKDLAKDKSIINIKKLKIAYHKYIEIFKNYNSIMHYMLSKTAIESLQWHTEVGTGDAALTAISAGLFWSIKGNIITLVSARKNQINFDFYVKPNYSRVIFEVDFNCIISIRIVNIIIAGIKMIYVYILNKLSGKGGELYERSSNTGANENYNG